MANEITISNSVDYDKNDEQDQFSSGNQTVDVAGDHYKKGIQTIGFAAAEAIEKGDVVTVGWCRFKNLDATNFVLIGYDDTGFKHLLKLLPGEAQVVRLSQSTPQAQADTGAVLLAYTIYEE